MNEVDLLYVFWWVGSVSRGLFGGKRVFCCFIVVCLVTERFYGKSIIFIGIKYLSLREFVLYEFSKKIIGSKIEFYKNIYYLPIYIWCFIEKNLKKKIMMQIMYIFDLLRLFLSLLKKMRSVRYHWIIDSELVYSILLVSFCLTISFIG